MHAVGQEHHKKMAIRIDPNRCACKTGVAERTWPHKMAARTAFGRNRPPQGSRAPGELLRFRKFRNCCAAQNSPMGVYAAVQQHLAERSQVRRRAEYAGMARNSTNGRRIFIVNFALNQAMAVLIVDFG